QAEDVIRFSSVTGVQTCALPIFLGTLLNWLRAELDVFAYVLARPGLDPRRLMPQQLVVLVQSPHHVRYPRYPELGDHHLQVRVRSEERRVGTEVRCSCSAES